MEKSKLKEILNQESVLKVICCLVEICYEKADFIQNKCRDYNTAREWGELGDNLNSILERD